MGPQDQAATTLCCCTPRRWTPPASGLILRSWISAAAPTLAVRSMVGMLNPISRPLMDFFMGASLGSMAVSFLLLFAPAFPGRFTTTNVTGTTGACDHDNGVLPRERTRCRFARPVRLRTVDRVQGQCAAKPAPHPDRRSADPARPPPLPHHAPQAR
jgi:hypothetical protein